MNKIDFKKPDSFSQLELLRDLLIIEKPTRADIALALVLVTRIFFKHCPGKLSDTDYYISGTGCHNPDSYKDGRSLMGVWQTQLEIGMGKSFYFDLSLEIMHAGFLTANIFSRQGWHWTVTADIAFNKQTEELIPESIIVVGGYLDCLMAELRSWLAAPLLLLASTSADKEQYDTFIEKCHHLVPGLGENYSPSPAEKAFVAQVRQRLPKRYGPYFFPKEKPEDVAFRDQLFMQLEQVEKTLEAKSNERASEVSRILDPLMVRLMASIPANLHERIINYFSFDGSGNSTRYDLKKLFVKKRESTTGMLILKQFPLSFDEIIQLNMAWNSFVYIDPELHYFRIYKPNR